MVLLLAAALMVSTPPPTNHGGTLAPTPNELARVLAPDGAPPRTLLVLPLTARTGVPRTEVDVLGDYLASEARRIPGHKAMSMKDIEAMISVEQRAQLLGCSETSCLAEIGGALSAEEVLTGTVGRLGSRELVVTLTRISPRNAETLGAESERLKGGTSDAALDALARLIKRLYPSYVPPDPRVKPLPRTVLLGMITGVGAALQYAAFASMFASLLFAPCPILALGFLGGSFAACALTPCYVSAIQAWLMDLVGRRQVGFRHATWIGTLALALNVVLTGFIIGAGALAGFLVGWALPAELATRRDNVQNLLRLFVPLPQDTIANFTLLGVACGCWVGLAALVITVPFSQAIALAAMSRPRDPETEVQRPTLYAPFEEVPFFARWLPNRLLGGAPTDVEALPPEQPKADPPAASTPPAAAPPPDAATPVPAS